MPNIRTYTNPIGGLTPDQRGTEALGRTAQALSETAGAQQREVAAQDTTAQGAIQAGQVKAQAMRSLGQDLGGAIQSAGDLYVKYRTTQDASRNGPVWSGIQDQIGQMWDQVAKTSDPNDPSVRQKFLDQTVEPILEKFQEAWSTKEGQAIGQGWVNNYRQHLYDKTQGDEASLAGQAALQNQEVTKNSVADHILRDPSSYKQQVEFYKDFVAHTIVDHPMISPEVAASIGGAHLTANLHDFALAEVAGRINMHPAQAAAEIDAGIYDHDHLDEGDVKMLQGEAQAAIVRQRTAADIAATAQDKKNREDYAAAHNQLFVQDVQIDAGGRISLSPNIVKHIQQLAAMPGAPPDAAETAMKFVAGVPAENMVKTRSQLEPLPINPTVNVAAMRDLTDRLYAGGDAADLQDRAMKAANAQQITGEQAVQIIRDSVKPASERVLTPDQHEWVSKMGQIIDHSTPFLPASDPNLATKALNWSTYATGEIAKDRAAGIPWPKTRDRLSVDFNSYTMGNAAALGVLNNKFDPTAPAFKFTGPKPPAFLPNESVAAYKKRTGQ